MSVGVPQPWENGRPFRGNRLIFRRDRQSVRRADALDAALIQQDDTVQNELSTRTVDERPSDQGDRATIPALRRRCCGRSGGRVDHGQTERHRQQNEWARHVRN